MTQIVAAPGFLGLRVRDDAAVRILGSVCNELSVGRDAAPVEGAPSVLLDYASPNMCKELHAGHLRSSVLGDTLAALFEDAGWRVTRVSHLGDWGTPVCTVVTHLMESGNPVRGTCARVVPLNAGRPLWPQEGRGLLPPGPAPSRPPPCLPPPSPRTTWRPRSGSTLTLCVP